MKLKNEKTLIVWIIACMFGCNKSGFEIDPGKTYTPSQLTAQAGGKCNTIQSWEGKMVRVRGRIDQPALFKSQNGGKFQLLDEKGFIEVYVEKASSEEVSEIYHKVLQGSGVTATGKKVAWEKETQLKCRKSV